MAQTDKRSLLNHAMATLAETVSRLMAVVEVIGWRCTVVAKGACGFKETFRPFDVRRLAGGGR